VSAINLLPINYREKLRFFIIGNGEKKYVEKIKNLITNHGLEKNFIFTGYLNTEYNTILPNLDLSIDLTRSNNGFGFSPAEAVSLSVPVIVTSVGAIPEWLNDKYCSVIRPASIIDIKNELVSFIDKNEFWKKRAKDAAIYINREFNAENMASNLIVHFEQKLNELP
jgi:glycosyltransferase involved in cell wall biosynthesis